MLCPFHQGQSAIHGHTVACHLIRLAAKTGAIARRPRRRAVRKKQDILSLWTPSRTTGFAINARRYNSTDKLAIARTVASFKSHPGDLRIDTVHSSCMGAERYFRHISIPPLPDPCVENITGEETTSVRLVLTAPAHIATDK